MSMATLAARIVAAVLLLSGAEAIAAASGRAAPATEPALLTAGAIARACARQDWKQERHGALLRTDCVGQVVWLAPPAPRSGPRPRLLVHPPLTRLADRPAGAGAADE